MAEGRWRCLECPSPIWVTGTYQDWMAHYFTHHQQQEAPHGVVHAR